VASIYRLDQLSGWLRSVLSFFTKMQGLDPIVAIGLTLLMSVLIGLIHGLLITKAKLQPFVVTLCGLLIYRSLSRWLTDNQSLGPVPLEGDLGFANLEQILMLDFIFSGQIPIGGFFKLPTPGSFSLSTCTCLARSFLGRQSGVDIYTLSAIMKTVPDIVESTPIV
jgi:ribose/xylose/arabinose/galactoside ABC-type transport system permease subunit